MAYENVAECEAAGLDPALVRRIAKGSHDMPKKHGRMGCKCLAAPALVHYGFMMVATEG